MVVPHFSNRFDVRLIYKWLPSGDQGALCTKHVSTEASLEGCHACPSLAQQTSIKWQKMVK
jgi:hypothetical protein